MCKYLAYYHPEGSWLSKKTYELMVSRPCGEQHITITDFYSLL